MYPPCKLPDGTGTEASLGVAIDADGTSAHAYGAAEGTRSGVAILDTAGRKIRIVENRAVQAIAGVFCSRSLHLDARR